MLYEKQFHSDFDFSQSTHPQKFLVIAATARSGSHMLGHCLHETGMFGCPLEYANAGNLSRWRELLKVEDNLSVIAELKKRRTSPNGVFGIKFHHSQLRNLGGMREVCKLFPNAYYVFLSRRDLLGQAISFSIASQTGVWIDGQSGNGTNPEYDFDHIYSRLRGLAHSNSEWRLTLSSMGCHFIDVVFEDLCSDLSSQIRRIAEFTNEAYEEIPNPRTKTVKQSNAVNSEWRERFLADMESSDIAPSIDSEASAQKPSAWDSFKDVQRVSKLFFRRFRKG